MNQCKEWAMTKKTWGQQVLFIRKIISDSYCVQNQFQEENGC